MLGQVDAQVLYNEYLMSRSQDPRHWILVEGDDECHLIDRHLDLDEFHTIPAQGKPNVIAAVPLFDRRSALDVFYLMDADFGPISGYPIVGHPRVVYTDAYDVEAELLLRHPSVVRALIYTYARKYGLPAIDGFEVARLVDEAKNLSIAVGAARFVNVSSGLGLKTSDLPFAPLVSALHRGAALATLVRIVASKSGVSIPNSGLSISRIRGVALAYGDALISGHDLIAALAAVVHASRSTQVSKRALKNTFHALSDCPRFGVLPWIGPLNAWGLGLGAAAVFLCARRTQQGGC